MMKNTFIISCFAILFIFQGCSSTPKIFVQSDISLPVKNAIAICNGGIETETSIKIRAAVEQNRGQIDAGLNSALRGIFLSRQGYTSSDAIKAQENYMQCLRWNSDKDKLTEIRSCQAKLTCEIDTLQQVCNCRTAIDKIAIERDLSEAQKNSALAKNCYSGAYDIRKCWATENANSGRSSCTVSLNAANIKIPVAEVGSCLAKDERN